MGLPDSAQGERCAPASPLGTPPASGEDVRPPEVTVARIYEYGGMGRAKGWGVFLDGRLVSDHASIEAARTTAIRHQALAQPGGGAS